jgi:hypothetical protein
MGARNQVGIGLSYRPASLYSLATQFQTRFLESSSPRIGTSVSDSDSIKKLKYGNRAKKKELDLNIYTERKKVKKERYSGWGG